MNRLYCGIDFGGTSTKLAIADASGEILLEDAFPTGDEGAPEIVVPRMATMVSQMIAQLPDRSDGQLSGIGIGVPGLVDIESGTTRFLPNLPTQWRDVPVARTLSGQLNCPVRLLNDVRTATLAELRYGYAKQLDRPTFAFFSIGTGIGGGVVVDGKLRMGSLGSAGELGHQTILIDGPQCGCGNRGCLEALAGGAAIAAEGVRLMIAGDAPALFELAQGDEKNVSPQLMAQAAESDVSVADAIEQAAIYIGIAAANVVVTLHPHRIVLGGGVSSMGKRLTVPVKREITQRVGMFPTDDVAVECSKLGERAGIRGAVALAIQASDSSSC